MVRFIVFLNVTCDNRHCHELIFCHHGTENNYRTELLMHVNHKPMRHYAIKYIYKFMSTPKSIARMAGARKGKGEGK